MKLIIRSTLTVLLFILLAISIPAQPLSGKGTYTFSYEEHYYHGVGESVLTIDKTSEGYKAVWKGITDTTEVFADSHFNTSRIIFTDNDTNLVAEREGAILSVKGVDEGRKVEASYNVGSAVWNQLLPFSLIPFTVSGEVSMDFFLFDPYNKKPRNMRIEKKGSESIIVLGKNYSAVKMSMRMKGMLSPFWKSEIWCDAKDGFQIKYEGINVIPRPYKAKILLKQRSFQPLLPSDSSASK